MYAADEARSIDVEKEAVDGGKRKSQTYLQKAVFLTLFCKF